jgi:hypothetical protein
MTTTLIREASAAPAARRRTRHRWPAVVLLGTGLALVAGAQLWRGVAVPALVKFPTDVDLRLDYAGTFHQYVDATTAAPLPEPAVAALSITRDIEVVPDMSGANEVVVRETVEIDVAGLPSSTHVQQYVMDRSTNVNVADPRAWAFEEDNVVDRSGAYRVALPRDLDRLATVPMFNDDIGGSYRARVGGNADVVEGLSLVAVAAGVAPTPVSDAYLRTLDAVTPMPRALTFDELKPSLVAAGIPVDDVLAALVAVATPDDVATLAELAAEPIPLQYVTSFTGDTLVEPDTGAVVAVESIIQRVSARPTGDAVDALREILARYRADPVIAAAVDGLDRLTDEPLAVFEYRYAETEASVRDMAAWVTTQRDRMRLAEQTIPRVLTIAGVVAAAGGAVLLALRTLRQRKGMS